MNFRLQNLSGDPTVDDPLMIRKLQWRWNERINFAHTWHDRLAFRRKQPVCNTTMRPTKTWANSIARRSFNFWPVHSYSFFLPSHKIFSFFLWEGAGFGEWASNIGQEFQHCLQHWCDGRSLGQGGWLRRLAGQHGVNKAILAWWGPMPRSAGGGVTVVFVGFRRAQRVWLKKICFFKL